MPALGGSRKREMQHRNSSGRQQVTWMATRANRGAYGKRWATAWVDVDGNGESDVDGDTSKPGGVRKTMGNDIVWRKRYIRGC